MLSALAIVVRGRVQGVGFRPFIFQIADYHRICGTVQNNMDGVKIHIEGEEQNVKGFLADLQSKAPRLSKIAEVIIQPGNVLGYQGFEIIPSERTGTSMLVLPIDSAVCDDCLAEMNDPEDFRYHYPFINCTQCGPRYTIISDLPYDRPYTSMNSFSMCPECRSEYENPLDRRHHAQPIACPKCGPQLKLFRFNGELIDDSPLERARELLNSGSIIAIKGLGGYHLCCDATNDKAVAALRVRKKRLTKPLAIMSKNLEAVMAVANADNMEKRLLQSPESPICILKKKHTHILANSIAPKMSTIGVMLPYTPLHHLLFQQGNLEWLVMTSANPSGQPILYQDDLAFDYLAGIADYLLVHNRIILHPADDSVVQISEDKIDFMRRSRGYVPDPINSAEDVNGIVSFGGQQKATFTIGRNSQIFVGPHIGDLENIETINHYKQELDHLLKWIEIPLQTAAIDLHPGFNTRMILKEYPFAEVIEIQHHHAHMAACISDNDLKEDVWGIILDGTGYGEDGNIWGFEIFHGNELNFDRMAHLKYTPLPGGEKSIKEPWRNAVAMLISLLGDEGEDLAYKVFPHKRAEVAFLKGMIDKKLNSPLAGTCGRLFDAVSAICGICEHSGYDGEAAISLAELVDPEDKPAGIYLFEFEKENEIYRFDFTQMIKQIAMDHLNGRSAKEISLKFHETLVQAIVTGLLLVKEKSGRSTDKVVLSGGSFHNKYLLKRVKQELETRGLEIYTHQKIPCNDGGLSYGQLIVAAARRRKTECV